MREQFGKTDLLTSPIVYGCMGGAGAFGVQEERDSIQALQTAYDVGINFFDTAEAYGNGYSEQLLHKALGEKRKDLIISSKVNKEHLSKDDILTACDRSLRNLGTDYIDIYLLHWPNRDVPLAESMEALKHLQKQGKIRYYGVSNFGKLDLSESLELGDVVTNQLPYHLFHQAIEFDVQPICAEQNIPIMCYSSLMQGLLVGKYRCLQDFPVSRARTTLFDYRKWKECVHKRTGAEDAGQKALDGLWKLVDETSYSMSELAVGWLKAQPSVGGVIVGTRNKTQSLELTRLLQVDLDEEICNTLSEITEDLKHQIGSDIDMWGKGRTR